MPEILQRRARPVQRDALPGPTHESIARAKAAQRQDREAALRELAGDFEGLAIVAAAMRDAADEEIH